MKGIDCPGCAWPEPEAGKRHKNEYCENGAKHINDEATTRRITREFFREHSVSELAAKKDMWLNEQGRLTEPMVKRPGSDHYEPISWDDALDLLAAELRGLDSPDEAFFYTSGRLSNEAAFLLQLFARAYGTNNLPDCSNMCHESSGAGLNETLGVGKGSVSLDDLHEADLVLVSGPQPRHQYASDAFGAGGDEAQRWVRHRCQPVAGSGAHSVQEPSDSQAESSAGAPRSPTSSCTSSRAATWRCSRRSMPFC